MKRILLPLLCLCLLLTACSTGNIDQTTNAEKTSAVEDTPTALAAPDMTKWQYNEADDVYYQIGISYCANPVDADYETLAIFVPGAYFDAKQQTNGLYECTVNEAATVGNYTSATAPIVFPVNTPGYSAQAALTGYSSFKAYTAEGFVYVHAGCRGRDAGAPAGVTDLKAAIRYLRYVGSQVPGDPERIFVFGMSGGGAQAAVLGASGDSELYTPYLQTIGAVMETSDAVCGSMDWCPITNLDSADAAYEWMMGCTRTELSEENQAISDALAASFAEYINALALTDESGTPLTLEESADGIWQAGSYYDYLMSVIETSLNNFLSDTSFPYDASASGGMGGFGGPGGGFGGRGAGGPGRGGAPGGDNISRTGGSAGVTISGTYETAQAYIDALNANGQWVTYDPQTNTAAISSISAFAQALKPASKSLGAFDQLDEGQGENQLFGYNGSSEHFDAALASILESLGSESASAYAEDLTRTDAVGYTPAQRLAMYTPLYYLLPSQEGFGTASVAKYWRIRTGICQSDTALTTEVNLALALQQYGGVEQVDFSTVWGQGHTQAERTGSAESNFIQWIKLCCDR